MRNKIAAVLLILCMAVATFGLTGCNMLDMFSESDYTYDAEKVQASIDALTASGYKITIRYLTVGTESGSQPEVQSSGFTIAADGELWYCEQVEEGFKSTVIMDFSGETGFVTYTKNDGEDKWLKETTPYEYYGSKETVKSLYMDTYLATFTSYGVIGLGLKDKGAVTVAGRACTKYAVSVSAFGASYSNEYCIDNETGLCLKNVMAVGSTTEGSASTSYECTAFEVGYRIALPADSECVTESEYDPGNDDPEYNDPGNTDIGTDIDFGSIMSGGGSSDVIYGELDEATKQLIIAEAQKDGVEVSFGADGSMTVVDATTGDTIVQKPDGTWVIKGSDGSEGQLGGNWPENEFTKLLPKPDFALLAASTTEYDFSVGFENVTAEQVKDYVERVKANGFTLDAETTDQETMGMEIYMYTAKNEAGYTVTVTFTAGISSVVVEKP